MSGRTYVSGAAKRRKAAEEKLSIAKLPKLSQYFSSTTAQEPPAPIPTGSAAGINRNEKLQLSPPPVAEKDATPSTSTDTTVPEILRPSCEELQQPPTEELLETHQTPKHVSNDPANWLQFTEEDRTVWIRKGPEFFQNRNCDFSDSARSYTEHDGKVKHRCLNPSVFSRKLQNGETVDRSWLIYSSTQKVLFCFPCRLFSPACTAFSSSKGFNDWKHSGACILEHENSLGHRQAILTYVTRKKSVGLLDEVLATQLNDEMTYWRQVLRRIVEVVKFLASRGLAFRGDNQVIGSQHNGNYLGALELLSKFDPFIADHLHNYANKGRGHVSYLSASVCNEFIAIMGQQVLSRIISELNKAKYYSISVDSTPDISHVDQLTFVVRYMKDCSPIERFLDFIPIERHGAAYLSDTVVSFLEENGIRLEDCRGQTYDNAPNMAGQYNGLQAKIKEYCTSALFVPCLAHSLNLVVGQAAGCVIEATDYFQLLQKLYSFFASSTHRWNVLKESLGPGTVVKRLSDTRWSARADAVSALQKSYPGIIDALMTMDDERELPETRNEARGILKKMETLDTVLLTEMWSNILVRCNETSKSLQSDSLPLDVALKLVDSLLAFVEDQRDKFENYEAAVKQIYPDFEYKTNLTKTTRSRQRSSRLTFFDGAAEDTQFQGREKFRIEVYLPIIDSLITQLQHRSKAYHQLLNLFGFFSRLSVLRSEELKNHCQTFSEFYENDVDEKELLMECEHFKHYLLQEKMLDDHIPIYDMYKLLKSNNLVATFPNVEIAFRIFLCLMITNASGERSFSKLKLIKNELRNSMSQEKLKNLSLMSIENDVLQDIDFKDVIEDFASQKARKKPL